MDCSPRIHDRLVVMIQPLIHGPRRRGVSFPFRPWISLLLVVAGFGACAGQEPESPPSFSLEALVKQDLARPAFLRHGHQAVVLGSELFVLGGYSGRPGVDDRGSCQAFAYDFAERSFRRLPDLPLPMSFFAAGASDGELVAVGGKVVRYDAEAASWQTSDPEPPVPRNHHVGAALKGRFYVLGGFPEDAGRFASLGAEGADWREEPPPPGYQPGDHLHVIGVLSDGLHIVGGIGGESFRLSRLHHVFDGRVWKGRAEAPEALTRKFFVSAVLDDELYVFGTEAAFCYDPAEDHWRSVASLPDDRIMATSFVREGRIVVFGGAGADSLLVYEPERDEWRTLALTDGAE